MLGVIGFISAAIAIALFIFSYRRAYPRVDARTSSPLVIGLSLLMIVMVFCAFIVSQASTGQYLAPMILTIDVIMLIATGFMLSILLPGNSKLLTILLIVFMALVIGYRAYTLPPTAYVLDGILYFNLEGAARTLLMIAILGIWYPALHIAGSRAAQTLSLPGLSTVLALGYFMLAVATAAFFSTTQRSMIIATFGGLVLTFISIAAINIFALRLSHLTSRKGIKRGKSA